MTCNSFVVADPSKGLHYISRDLLGTCEEIVYLFVNNATYNAVTKVHLDVQANLDYSTWHTMLFDSMSPFMVMEQTFQIS